MKFLNNVDLDKNQLLQVVIHSAAVAPGSPVDGQIYYNTATAQYYYYRASDTTWVPFGGGNIIGGDGLAESTVAGITTLSVNVDGVGLEISADIVRLKDLGVTAAKLANNAVTTVKVTDKNITFAKIQDIPTMTVIGRVAAGSGVPSAIAIINDNTMASALATNLATAGSIKAYVDSRITELGSLQGAFNATTATNFPGGAATFKGHYWYVTVAGTVQSVVMNVGDVLIANKDNPSVTLAADWIFLESNRDQATTTILGVVSLATAVEVQTGTDTSKVVTPSTLSQRTATTTRTGLAALATQAEVTAGTDNSKIVTPLTLKTVLDAALVASGFATNVGDASALTYVVTHSFGTKDIVIELFDATTGATVYADVTRPTVNTVGIAFAKAPALNAFRVTVKKN
ncbi:hypothetical protein DYBT9623_04420 [Dyadobacter sp. CECT 9623]|uniref:DUF5689 domain-containing protein n=1 Tax=Dyadobacter linearis TaxID=2823330 RepID=A0ABM8UVW5_9BACT|nr:hypothetical protein [Dyadobacter sp. CECT 9623]CAG5072880.1 hypothetical protein DYBT9623_04420 [Dyadobacter sp. CECT 9623]